MAVAAIATAGRARAAVPGVAVRHLRPARASRPHRDAQARRRKSTRAAQAGRARSRGAATGTRPRAQRARSCGERLLRAREIEPQAPPPPPPARAPSRNPAEAFAQAEPAIVQAAAPGSRIVRRPRPPGRADGGAGRSKAAATREPAPPRSVGGGFRERPRGGPERLGIALDRLSTARFGGAAPASDPPRLHGPSRRQPRRRWRRGARLSTLATGGGRSSRRGPRATPMALRRARPPPGPDLPSPGPS